MTTWTGTLPSWGVRPIPAADLKTMVDALAGLTDAMSTYTPAWASAGTQPALGNGTLIGRYLLSNHFTAVQVKLTAGTTTTFGTGVWSFSLPPGVTNAAATDAIGSALLLDASATRYSASCEVGAGASTIAVVAGSTNYITASIPFTWTTSDAASIAVVLQA